MADEASVRGVVVIGLVHWLRRTHGDDATDDIIAALPGEHAELLRGRALIQTTRVRATVFRAFADGVIARYGLHGPGGYRSGAGYVAEADLSSYMKILIAVGTPSFVAKRFPRVWRHYFDAGELEVRSVDDEIDVTISGASVYGDAALEGAVGWMKQALELSHSGEVGVERLGSADSPARYEARWR